MSTLTGMKAGLPGYGIVPVTCIKLLYVRIKLSYEKFCAWYLLIYKVFLIFMTSETCVMKVTFLR